ncbi:acetyl-CoA carboxylase biotin carboxyl carrier protein [Paucilactobacillus wasatchensis]|uniref:Biotin carboxyl carrier protein of acetyl-CoA carboxylase n=1 Tax=Paucilactobacillus wasatchensis TaxID=1335616 RepID=A0A0D0Y676_9LACO|nr:biotin/lipoyl-containing protein [Paucilactobacillus wasatchensis]KIS03778.1 Biotin carboxyl carrier protein of acetyl-CoA carboxylase [Paucilactobacillus wasatchensis]
MNEKQIQTLIEQLAKFDFVHAKIKIDEFELDLDRDQLAAQSQPEDAQIQTINSPMIGIFHTNEHPIQVGSVITPKTVVGQIESMKLFNDISASMTGKVEAVLCEDGQAVDYAQPLFRVILGAAE